MVVAGKVDVVPLKQLIDFIEELLPGNPLLAILLQASHDESSHSQRNGD